MPRTDGLRTLLGRLGGVLAAVEQVADHLDTWEPSDDLADLASVFGGAPGEPGPWYDPAHQERAEALERLGFFADARPTADEVRAAWRACAREHHPDAGGDPQQFAELTAARDYLVEQARA